MLILKWRALFYLAVGPQGTQLSLTVNQLAWIPIHDEPTYCLVKRVRVCLRARLRVTWMQVPYFNAPIFLENKSQVGKVEEIFGKIKESVRRPPPTVVSLVSLVTAVFCGAHVRLHNRPQ